MSTSILAACRGRSGRDYAISIGRAATYPREGELCISITDPDGGVALSRLTFLLSITPRGGHAVMIGGLQGPQCGLNAKERIIRTTRDLSGLRPKMAVLMASASFAAITEAEAIYAVGNRTHVVGAGSHRGARGCLLTTTGSGSNGPDRRTTSGSSCRSILGKARNARSGARSVERSRTWLPPSSPLPCDWTREPPHRRRRELYWGR